MDNIVLYQEANRLSQLLNEITLEQEYKVISRLISEYRSGTLTNENLWGGIAEISALRSLKDKIERDKKKALKEVENGT